MHTGIFRVDGIFCIGTFAEKAKYWKKINIPDGLKVRTRRSCMREIMVRHTFPLELQVENGVGGWLRRMEKLSQVISCQMF